MVHMTQAWRAIGLIEERIGLNDATAGDANSYSYSEATR